MKLRSALIAGAFAVIMAGMPYCPWLCLNSDDSVPSAFGCPP